MEGLMRAGIGLISAIPLLFALTYYIFDFGLWSTLFMPLLYIVCGIPLNVMLIIAFYSWGMTWQFRSSAQ